jgi:hypothetical protein
MTITYCDRLLATVPGHSTILPRVMSIMIAYIVESNFVAKRKKKKDLKKISFSKERI